ncbi:MAG: response regulator transcription factor [Opitutaceae bacterium]
MNRRHILLAEDDLNIQTGLVDVLGSEGYETTTANTGADALNLAKQSNYDLILLDVMMPELNGYDVCRSIRSFNQSTPIIMLTAKGEEIDKVVGLELGADDYVTKPFGVRELLARIAAALRRSSSITNSNESSNPIIMGKATIDPKRFEVQLNGNTESLTPRELKLLQTFHAHPGEALSRDTLLNAAWGIDYLGTTRTLDQHIAQLRKKIETTPTSPQTLITVHGHGYRYEP